MLRFFSILKQLPVWWRFAVVLFSFHQLFQYFDWNWPWADGYLDPLLCMPIILPLLQIEQRLLTRKGHEYKLPLLYVILYTFIMVIFSESLFPLWSLKFTADPIDLIYFFVGAFAFHHLNTRSSKSVT